ncbi:sigma-70 family RNA polymerase sigma factor [bacterium]|nr:sigma-70 family RNA polymerase sigma factor [bacterium]
MKKDLSEEKDEILVQRSKDGDKEAFDILVQRYRASLFRFVYHCLHNREDAEDIAQEAFVRAYISLSQLKDNALFRTWLFRIALNLIRDNKRAAKRNPTLSFDSYAEGDDTHAETKGDNVDPSDDDSELLARLRTEIALLPSELREVIILRDLQGFSYEEIAKMINCPLGTVKSRLFYARQILRERLSSFLGDEKE